MDLGLDGRVALVTGASRGLGAQIAVGLAAEGALVVAAARSAEALAELAREAPEHISTAQVDLSDPAATAGLAELVLERHGHIDILVNNAGVAPAGDFATQDPEIWQHVLTLNVLAPMRLAQIIGRHMRERGSGKIINIASTTGIRGKPGLVAYSMSKGALIRMSEALAAEWARDGVQVNVIAPGAFVTDAQRIVLESPDLLRRRVRRIPAERMGEPSEIVPVACLLASPRSDFITGSTYVIDGGEAGKL